MKKSGSALAQARGLGSAKAGLEHWKAQRLTAIAMIPLMLWFVSSLISLSGAGHAEVVAWFAAPFNAIGSVLLLGTMFYHANLGLQVVVEDYVQHEGAKITLLIAIRFFALVLGAATIFAVLKMAFAG